MKLTFQVILVLSLIIVSSYMAFAIPGTGDIPFTLQSLMIFALAAFIGPKVFLMAILSYFILGGLGVPVFAEGANGWSQFVGNSGGFLYGFLPAGLFVSSYFDERENVTFIGVLNIMLQATMVLFFFGLIHLSFKLSVSSAVQYGLLPFWKMALLKCVMASIIVYLIKAKTNFKGFQ